MAINSEAFKKKLLAQKVELEATIEQATDAAKPVELDQTVVGRVSRIDAIQQQEMTLAAQRRRVEQIQKIEAALGRIKSGDFGCCVKCGEDIAEKRLALDPAIPTCINCAQGA
jgi:DnaK suppressor protein